MDMRTLINLCEHQQLDELQGVKAHPKRFLSKDEFLAYMAERGFEKLGAGHYGAVFDHPAFGGRYVLKVFSDPAYEAFLEFCATHKSPHLPRVTGKVIKVSQNARMVRLERLEPMTRAQADAADLDGMGDAAWQIAKGEATIDLYPEYQGSTLFELLIALERNTGIHMSTDLLGERNFMLRGDTIVVSDPYVGHESFRW
jgi:hypothetical protein